MTTQQLYGDSFILDRFRAFYSEIIRLKQRVQSGIWTFLAELSPEDVRDQPHAMQAVWQRLFSLLEEQALVAGHSGMAYGSVLYREVQ